MRRTGKRMANRPARMRLKELRERAGFTGDEVAKACGFRGRAGYLKYEQERQQGDDKIPYHLVAKLLSVFVGKGTPPITVDDLLEISDKKPKEALLSTLFRQPAGAQIEDDRPPPERGIPVKYTIEEGVYVSQAKIDQMESGRAPIISTIEYEDHQQFATAVVGSRLGDYPSGTYLHCVSEVVPGKRLVIASEFGGAGIFCLTVAVRHEGGALTDLDGKRVEGRVLGSVIGAYRKE